MCQKVQPLLVEEEIYYNQGRNKRLAYLCCSDFHHKNKDPCHDIYMRDSGLGEHLLLSGPDGWYEQTYHTIRSIFISCPVLFSTTTTMTTTTTEKEEDEGRRRDVNDDTSSKDYYDYFKTEKEKREKNNSNELIEKPTSQRGSKYFLPKNEKEEKQKQSFSSLFSIIKRLRKKNKGKGKRTKDNNDNNNQNSNGSSSNSNNDTDSFKGMES